MPVVFESTADKVQGPIVGGRKLGFRRWIANKMFGRHSRDSRDLVLTKVTRGKAHFTTDVVAGCSGGKTRTKIFDASVTQMSSIRVNALCGFKGVISPVATTASCPGRVDGLALFQGYYDQIPSADQADDLAVLIKYNQDVTVGSTTPRPPPRQFNPGTAMMPYTIRDLLGDGSMGVVYTASDVGKEVAVKLARTALLIGPTMQEFVIMRKLNHLNVVQALSPVRGGFVMERLGTDLAAILENGDPSNHAKFRVAAGVVEGLRYVHSRGIAHLDMKPSNVLIDREYTPKLTDFGLSARFLCPKGKQMLLKMFVGTPAYLSPEVLRFRCGGPRGVLMTPVDVWACGCLFYELLTRTVPFGDEDIQSIYTSKMGLATSGLTVPPSAVSGMRQDKDVALLFLATQKMLDIRPDKRPSAAHMAKLYFGFVEGKSEREKTITVAKIKEKNIKIKRRKKSNKNKEKHF